VPPVPAADALAAARAAVSWAAAHLAEREASFRAIDLATHALRHVTGRGAGLAEVRAAIAEHSGLIPGAGGRMTTRAALALEHANLARLREGLLPSGTPVLARPYQAASGSTLGSDQLRVVRHLLESRAQVLGVEGKPGTGKTHTLGVVREAAESAGWTVRGFAVSTGAVAQLREVGIAAETGMAGMAGTAGTQATPARLRSRPAAARCRSTTPTPSPRMPPRARRCAASWRRSTRTTASSS
jgi:AAA domain